MNESRYEEYVEPAAEAVEEDDWLGSDWDFRHKDKDSKAKVGGGTGWDFRHKDKDSKASEKVYKCVRFALTRGGLAGTSVTRMLAEALISY